MRWAHSTAVNPSCDLLLFCPGARSPATCRRLPGLSSGSQVNWEKMKNCQVAGRSRFEIHRVRAAATDHEFIAVNRRQWVCTGSRIRGTAGLIWADSGLRTESATNPADVGSIVRRIGDSSHMWPKSSGFPIRLKKSGEPHARKPIHSTDLCLPVNVKLARHECHIHRNESWI